MAEYMRQCLLERTNDATSISRLVCWIDEKHAFEGDRLALRGLDGEWLVKSVGERQKASGIRQGNLDAIGRYGRK